MLKVGLVKIKNIMGIELLEFRPSPKICWIKGANGAGKTSLMEGIKAAISGGNDATIIRNGETEGESVLVFEDDRTKKKFATIEKPIGAKSREAKVKVEGLGPIGAAQTWIKGMIDLRSSNPIEFLELKNTAEDRKKRAQWLLDSLPISLSAEQMAADAGIELSTLAELNLGDLHPLTALSKLEKMLRDRRRENNVAAEDRERTIETLAGSAPAKPAGEVSVEALTERRKAVAELVIQRDSEKQRVINSFTDKRKGVDAEFAEEKARLEAIREEAIERARKEFDKSLAMATEARTMAYSVVTDTERGELATIDSKYEGTLAEARLQEERMAQALQDAGRVKQSEESQARFRAEAAEYRQVAKLADEAIDRITARRTALMAANPMADVVIDETGEMVVNGVIWPRLNTAEQVDTALKIAENRAGKIGMLCCDGIERLTPEHQEAFVLRAIASGHQYFITEPVDGPLAIESIESVEDFERMKTDNEARRQKARDERRQKAREERLEKEAEATK